MPIETLDEWFEAVARGSDPDELRGWATENSHNLSADDQQRIGAALERLPRRSGLVTMGGG